MNHLFKEQSLKTLIKYNQRLLLVCIVLSVSLLILIVNVVNRQEKWVLIPATDVEKRLTVLSKGYSETYLKEWAIYVMQTLMTTSCDTVDRQIEDLKVVSSSSQDLDDFFKKHLQFVKGSNIQSVFFPKSVIVEQSNIKVSGLFRYWLGSSDQSVSQEKTYLLTYKRGPKDILLLKTVKEQAL